MTTSTAPPPPAGWYPDPWQHATHRWWDGAAWTGHLATSAPQVEAGRVDRPTRSTFSEAVAAHAVAEQEREASVPRLDADHYDIAQRYRLMINEYDVSASGGSSPVRGAFVRQKRLALRERIELWVDPTQTQLLCVVQARKVMEVAGTYDVLDPLGRRIGTLRKRAARSIVRSTWEIDDDSASVVARVTEASLAVALLRRVQDFAEFVPVVGWALGLVPVPIAFTFHAPSGELLGRHRRIWGLRDRYELRIDGDPDQRLDRRLAVAMAICVDALQGR